MIRLRWTNCRHDLLVGFLASSLTASALVPIGWAAMKDQRETAAAAHRMAETAALLAEQKSADADQQRAQAQRNLIEQAADFAGFRDRSEAEVLRVTTAAVAPEIPQDAHVLIDKKASFFTVGDIVIYRGDGKNYIGRVVAVEKAAGHLTVGRNAEPNRQVAISEVAGRGVLNTR